MIPALLQGVNFIERLVLCLKRIFSFSFAFFLFLGLFSFNPKVVKAATAEQISKASLISPYFVERSPGTFIISQSPLTLFYNSSFSGNYAIQGPAYKWNDGEFLPLGSNQYGQLGEIIYTSYDLKTADGTVFFSAPLPPIPKALKEIVPNLGAQALKILPIAVGILAMVMGVSLISRVLYRYL